MIPSFDRVEARRPNRASLISTYNVKAVFIAARQTLASASNASLSVFGPPVGWPAACVQLAYQWRNLQACDLSSRG
jgi:hypothetical protein